MIRNYASPLPQTIGSVFGPGAAVWTPLRLLNADVHWDPNAIEDPANRFADQADGSIEGSLLQAPGAPAPTDPGEACGWSWPASNIFGRRLTGAQLFQLFVQTWELTPPVLTDDTYVFLGLANENTANSATVDGFYCTVGYPAAGVRRAGVITILNGVATVSVDAAPAGLLRRLKLSAAHASLGTAHYWSRLVASGLTDAGAPIGGAGDLFDAGINVDFGSGNLWWHFGFGRLTAAAPTVTLAHTPFVLAYPSPRGGYAPGRFG